MTIQSLDHVNIRSHDVPLTAKFFEDVLEMKATIPPGAESLDQGAWMWDVQGNPVVHIGSISANYPSDHAMPYTYASGSGSVHHVAFNCTDYAEVVARLKLHNYSFVESYIESIGLRQVFIINQWYHT